MYNVIARRFVGYGPLELWLFFIGSSLLYEISFSITFPFMFMVNNSVKEIASVISVKVVLNISRALVLANR